MGGWAGGRSTDRYLSFMGGWVGGWVGTDLLGIDGVEGDEEGGADTREGAGQGEVGFAVLLGWGGGWVGGLRRCCDAWRG